MIQKLFRLIIVIQKHGDELYILVVQSIQYSGMSPCGLVVLAKGHSQQGLIKVPTSQAVAPAYSKLMLPTG